MQVARTLTLLALAFVTTTTAAEAPTYPTQPITIVNGFSSGGNTDSALRQIAARLAERLGQPVVVLNRPGASGTIAAGTVARAVPDGHTLLFGVAANLAVAPAAMKAPPYDPVHAFAPIIEVASGPYIWMVRADLPVRTMPEFVAWARSKRGQGNYASPGVASVHHLASEMLLQTIGVEMVHIPGGRNLYLSLMAGEVDAMFDTLPGPIAHVKAGKLRALAVTGSKRLEVLPEVQTLAEQGLPDVPVKFWWGLVGPAGLPPSIVTRLNTEVAAILAEGPVQATFAAWGIHATGGSAESFGAWIAQESARWRDFAARTKIVLQ
jgi:tripartite-type tricarboxylate transporter receptor subunit TctC